jgi:hypothetical protein
VSQNGVSQVCDRTHDQGIGENEERDYAEEKLHDRLTAGEQRQCEQQHNRRRR